MSHSPDTEQHITECIGPRVVGTRWRSHYWGVEVTVLAVDRDPPGWELWTVTEATDEELARNASRTHCTRWDYDRDQVITQLQEATR
jgi:hypothetical protein